jgi:hypothetical protein
MTYSIWRYFLDGVALFKHKDRGPAVIKILLFFSVCECGLLYYVIYQPEFYLNSRASRGAPFLVWIVSPFMLAMVVMGIQKLRDDTRHENDDNK